MQRNLIRTASTAETPTARPGHGLRKHVRHELVLLVGRDPAMLAPVLSSLKSHGFGVASCSFRALSSRLHELRPNLIAIEALDDAASAAEACRTLRKGGSTPVVVLGTPTDEFTAALILEAGADDYLREPIGPAELVARCKAVLRRAEPFTTDGEAISVGPLRIDESQHTASLDGMELALSPTEYRLLAYLVRHPNRVVTHADIMSRVWGAGYDESHQLLRVNMSRLRRKISADRHRDVRIQSIAGFGYRLAVEATTIGLAG